MTDVIKHVPALSHEFEAGPSGPARAYWNITRNGHTVMTACVHPGKDGEAAANAICWALDATFHDGRKDKARELRKSLGI